MKTIVTLTAAIALAICGGASAQTFNFGMDGSQEVPAVPTPATGACTVVVSDPLNTVDVLCSYQGLIGNPTASHIHAPAPPGVNAGVVLPLTVVGGLSGTITSNGPQAMSETNIQHILAGNAYVNLHSSFRTGGEIRGQIVPEPATASILVLAGLALVRRRRR